MKRFWTYSHFLFAATLLFAATGALHAQRRGLPEQKRDAIGLRYQQYQNALPRFPKGYPLLHRLYLTGAAGIEAEWEASNESGIVQTDFSMKGGIGFKFTPVHAIEADYLYTPQTQGINLNYVLNLSAFATRQAKPYRFEAAALAGLVYRNGKKHDAGMHIATRFMYNPLPLVGVYIQPGLNMVQAMDKSHRFATTPYAQAGLMFRFGNPQIDVGDLLPPFALKTNLLFDLASALNVEIEFPIQNRFSIAADWVFPWWTMDNGRGDSKRSRLQILNGNLEGRYWFGNREKKRLLNGWFAGFYAGGGLYDVEWKGKGIQGEFFIAAGVSGGFAHRISEHLSMEYALGIGMVRTDYRTYEAHFCEDDTWYPIRQKRGRYTWIGPTRAKISLVWLINDPKKKGGSL